ncbi:MAG: hypothetical protein NVSMB57_05640 [Actinomycetota bacterium]
MSYYVGTILALSVGAVLLLSAEVRRWAPPIVLTLAVGAALRILIVSVVWDHVNQPLDFIHDFQVTGQAVLHHVDPLVQAPNKWGYPIWNSLPLMAYVFAAEQFIVQHAGIHWEILGRVLPVVADLGVVALIGGLARKDGALRSFQYACNPITLLVASVHGQVEPIALVFAVGGFVAARRKHPVAAGALLGLAITTKSWPVLLLPGLLFMLPGWRERRPALIAALAVPALFFLTMPLAYHANLIADARAIVGYRSIPGEFGWTGIATELLRGARAASLRETWSQVGTMLSLSAVIGAMMLWRKADGEDMTAAMVLAFLAVTAGFGMQYLAWPLPFIVARPTRLTQPFVLAAGAYAAVGYLYLGNLHSPAYQEAHRSFMFWSIPIVLLLIGAMPWVRRKSRSEEQEPETRELFINADRPAPLSS